MTKIMGDYDERYEKQIVQMAENRLKSKNFKIFDKDARVIKRVKLPELVATGKSQDSDCLVLTNREGETILLTIEIQIALLNILKKRF